MNCRPGCGACCIAISISSPIPGMVKGKEAGVRCLNLDELNNCTIHNTSLYPDVCRDLTPGEDICGINRDQALYLLSELERLTDPLLP